MMEINLSQTTTTVKVDASSQGQEPEKNVNGLLLIFTLMRKLADTQQETVIPSYLNANTALYNEFENNLKEWHSINAQLKDLNEKNAGSWSDADTAAANKLENQLTTIENKGTEIQNKMSSLWQTHISPAEEIQNASVSVAKTLSAYFIQHAIKAVQKK